MKIEIGLVLGGTVSAGAYTAGALDFLLQALAALEAKRNSGDADAPSHQPIIAAASGSSGGGICAAQIAIAATRRQTPIADPANPPPAWENPPYRMWTGAELSYEAFIDPSDLTGGNPGPDRPLSVLNGAVRESFGNIAFVADDRPADLAYIADPLPIAVATTTLRGVPYSIRFVTDKAPGDPGFDRQDMRFHHDHLRFSWSRTGQAPSGTILLDPTQFPRELVNLPQAAGWRDLRAAALATSAFPLVFPAYPLEKPRAAYDDHLADTAGPVDPDWPTHGGPDHRFYAVDAGTVNNEPLELTRSALVGPGGSFAGSANGVDKLILMIDPLGGGGLPEPSHQFFDLLSQIVGALVQNSRFKPSELLAVRGESIFSRHLLTPTRQTATGQIADQALASDLLAAFFGFFHADLRRHDYFLGRWNAWRFLKNHFVLPAGHPAFAGWTDPTFAVTKRIDGQVMNCRPIVPLYGDAAPEPARASWPHLDPNLFTPQLKQRTANRIGLLAQRIAGANPAQDPNLLLAAVMSVAKGEIANWIEASVEDAIRTINDSPA
ncbi:MAG: hypothetical protein HOH66_12725 [Rhodospirillaceae bacterium]|jgi:hypothetical protein|nr:hypothetical protein [Rhodospirillaceae bacterium]